MAEPLTRAFGDALIMLLDWSWPTVSPRVESAVERFAELVRPHPPISIVTLDGQTLTGVLVVDRGQVLAFLGTRQPTTARSTHERDYYDEGAHWSHAPYAR